MMNIEERKRIQDKLLLLTAAELREVDEHIEELMARRRRAVLRAAGENIRDRE